MHAVTALWHVCHLVFAPFVAFVVSVCSGRYFCMSKKFKFYVSFYVSEHCSQTCLIHDITTDVPSIITSSNSCSIRCAPDFMFYTMCTRLGTTRCAPDLVQPSLAHCVISILASALGNVNCMNVTVLSQPEIWNKTKGGIDPHSSLFPSIQDLHRHQVTTR